MIHEFFESAMDSLLKTDKGLMAVNGINIHTEHRIEV